MRDLGLAYILCLCQLFGVAGLHHFYLGDRRKGFLYLVTWGYLGFGFLYDLVTLPARVDALNLKALPATRLTPLPTLGYDPRILQTRIIHQAQASGARLTPLQVSGAQGISVEDAERELDTLAKAGHTTIEVDDEGVIFYDFPGLRLSLPPQH
ncbi:MAG: TM2 domain-containing protein [Nannocystaceae bacterium]